MTRITTSVPELPHKRRTNDIETRGTSRTEHSASITVYDLSDMRKACYR